MPLILYFYGSIGDCLKLVSFDTCYERYLPMRSSLGIWLEFCDKRAEMVELEPPLSSCFFVVVLHYKVSRAILFPRCMRISIRTIALPSFIGASYYSHRR